MSEDKKKRPPTKFSFRLVEAADKLTEAAITRPHDQLQAAIEEAQKDLTPWVEQAKLALGRVHDFQADNRPALDALARFNVKALAGLLAGRQHERYHDMVARLDSLLSQFAASRREALDVLNGIEGRVLSLGLPQLEQRVFAAEPPIVPKDGFYPRGVVAIKFDVHRMRDRAQHLRDLLRQIEDQMHAVAEYLGRHKADVPEGVVLQMQRAKVPSRELQRVAD